MVKKKVNYLFLFISIASIIVLIDQIIKYFIFRFKPVWISNILKIHFVKNTGAGFGLLQGQTLLLALISLIVAGGIIFYYKKIEKKKFPQILFAVFLGGTIGNFIDRIFRGYVIDFIDFSFWPAFNIADATISIAVVGLIVFYWKR